MFGKLSPIFIMLLIFPGIVACSNPVDVLEKKADQGSPSAMVELGLMYYQGNGVEQDSYIAAHWFQKAVEKDDPQGQYWLGLFTEKGIGGIKQDNNKAIHLYKQAAKQDHSESIIRLALIFENGELDQTQDENTALQWYQKAVGLNHTLYQKDIDRITAQIETKRLQKEESIRKEKDFEAGLSEDKIKVLIAITPEEVATAYQTHSTNPSVYYSEAGKSFEYLPGRTWQSVDGSSVTFYVTNLLKYTSIESLQITISGKTLQQEDELYIFPVTSDSKTEIITNLKPVESRKITVYFETEVKLESKGGTLAGIGAGLSNALAQAGKAAGNKGFRVAMNPDTIQFAISEIKGQYVGDLYEKLQAIIESSKSGFETIRVEASLDSGEGFKEWESTIALPYTTNNRIQYWEKYDSYKFNASIAETESTSEGRKRTNDFIETLESILGNEWTKRTNQSDIWDIWVTFQNGSTAIEVTGQDYKTFSHYQAELKIVRKPS